MADAADFVPAKKKSSDEADKRSVFFNNSTISTVFSNYGGISVLSDDCWADLGCKRKKLTPGSLMKALVRSGAGDANPSDGDQLIFHCTTRTVEGAVVNSTRSEYGGKGKHLRLVLGKSKMILGFAEGFPTMLKG